MSGNNGDLAIRRDGRGCLSTCQPLIVLSSVSCGQDAEWNVTCVIIMTCILFQLFVLRIFSFVCMALYIGCGAVQGSVSLCVETKLKCVVGSAPQTKVGFGLFW